MVKRGAKKGSGLEKRLFTYSVAAGAALAVAGPADANVIYSGAKNIPVDYSHPSVHVDINGDGVNDFRFSYYQSSWTTGPFFFESKGIWMAGSQIGNQAVGGDVYVNSFSIFGPFKLSNGSSVSAGMQGTWTGSLGILNGVKYSGGVPDGTYTYNYTDQNALGAVPTHSMGNFVGNRGFIGVRFKIGSNTHYGWIEYEGSGMPAQARSTDGQMTLKDGLPVVSGTIYGWAYEDVPGRLIKAGDKGQPAQAVPTLNEWGMIFLMGLILAEGARRLRKRSAEA